MDKQTKLILTDSELAKLTQEMMVRGMMPEPGPLGIEQVLLVSYARNKLADKLGIGTRVPA